MAADGSQMHSVLIRVTTQVWAEKRQQRGTLYGFAVAGNVDPVRDWAALDGSKQ